MTANKLYFSLTTSPSCRHTKTTSSQTWPKPYNKSQVPGGPVLQWIPAHCGIPGNKQADILAKEGARGEQHVNNVSFSERRLSSEHLQSQIYRGMTTSCCPGSNRSFWWGFAPGITDWTVICTVNWSWHPHQLAPVVKKSRKRSMFYKHAPFTKPQEKTCGLSALPWRPNSTAANRSLRRRHHSSPERPWSCTQRTPRRRRRSLYSSLSLSLSLSLFSLSLSLSLSLFLSLARARELTPPPPLSSNIPAGKSWMTSRLSTFILSIYKSGAENIVKGERCTALHCCNWQ